MDEKNLEKFDPTVAELTAMVASTKGITATDLKDRNQLEIVKTARISLKNARVRITKVGKELRADALAFQKAVIAKETELIAIIDPEETRLEAIEEEAKQLYIREERLKLLPTRKERLLAIDGVKEWATDEELLNLNSEAYEAFFNECTATHNEEVRLADLKKKEEEEAKLAKERADAQAKLDAERKAFEEDKAKEEAKRIEAEAKAEAKRKADQDKLDEEKRKIEAEKLAIQHAKEVEEAKVKAKEEAEAKAKADAEAKAKAEADENKRKEAEEKAEKAKLEKRKAFTAFRASHGYTEETKDDYITKETEEGYDLYKKVGTFNNH